MALISLFVILVAYAPPARAEWTSLTDAQLQQMHQEICQVPVHKGGAAWNCDAARDYPSLNAEIGDCSLSFNDLADKPGPSRIYFGRFTADAQQALVAYTSGCEPHAHDWGGSTLFRLDGSSFRFIAYFPGLVPEDCVVPMLRGNSRQRPFCYFSHVSQGETDFTFGPINLSVDGDVDLESWLSVSNSDGGLHGVTTRCTTDRPEIRSINAVKIAGKQSEIVVEGTYLRPSGFAAACARLKHKEFNADEAKVRAAFGGLVANDAFIRENENYYFKVFIRFRPPDKTPHFEYTKQPVSP
jgi:hypothetical protein